MFEEKARKFIELLNSRTPSHAEEMCKELGGELYKGKNNLMCIIPIRRLSENGVRIVLDDDKLMIGDLEGLGERLVSSSGYRRTLLLRLSDCTVLFIGNPSKKELQSWGASGRLSVSCSIPSSVYDHIVVRLNIDNNEVQNIVVYAGKDLIPKEHQLLWEVPIS